MLTIHWLVVAALMVFAGCVGVVVSALMVAVSRENDRAERAEEPFRIARAYVEKHYSDCELPPHRDESLFI